MTLRTRSLGQHAALSQERALGLCACINRFEYPVCSVGMCCASSRARARRTLRQEIAHSALMAWRHSDARPQNVAHA